MGNRFVILRSININVVPSFGRIVIIGDYDKNARVNTTLFSFLKLKLGNREKEPSDQDQQTSTQPDTSHSVSEKLLRIQSIKFISTNMFKDLDSQGD